MTQTTARIKKKGEQFEIIVDLDQALAFKKKGEGNARSFLEIDNIYTDSAKGHKASDDVLENAFGTTNAEEIAETIVKEGELLLTQEHRDEEQEKRLKQVVDFLKRNAVDPKSGMPHTGERIKNAIEEAGINIKNTAIESQIPDITESLRSIIPIKISTKKVKIKIPAVHTGKIYGLVNKYKEKENWLDSGDLEVVVNIPAGMIMDFYDKLNSVTHGSALTEEISEEKNE